MAFTPRNFGDKPQWVQNRRNSRHGVDFPFGNKVEIDCQSLLLHGDNVASIEAAERVRSAFEQEGVTLRAVGSARVAAS